VDVDSVTAPPDGAASARGGARLSDALSGLRGVVVRPSSSGRSGFVVQQRRLGQSCNVPLLVDGVIVSPLELNHIRPDEVEAVEVYGRGDVPMLFRRTYGGPSGCGAVLVWLKLAERQA
jgi:hypothetical protein